jgi:hypothetical protein
MKLSMMPPFSSNEHGLVFCANEPSKGLSVMGGSARSYGLHDPAPNLVSESSTGWTSENKNPTASAVGSVNMSLFSMAPFSSNE